MKALSLHFSILGEHTSELKRKDEEHEGIVQKLESDAKCKTVELSEAHAEELLKMRRNHSEGVEEMKREHSKEIQVNLLLILLLD